MACFYSAPLAWNPTGVDSQQIPKRFTGEIKLSLKYLAIPAGLGLHRELTDRCNEQQPFRCVFNVGGCHLEEGLNREASNVVGVLT
ncbi:hypothetical protein HMP06_0275 [Sphingomonas sp. HMP6]|nr:hypothetical protein HMP06_0275 [Sphingomonas sp. HMP6]